MRKLRKSKVNNDNENKTDNDNINLSSSEEKNREPSSEPEKEIRKGSSGKSPLYLFLYSVGGFAMLYMNRVKRFLSGKFSFIFDKIYLFLSKIVISIKNAIKSSANEFKQVIVSSKRRINMAEERLIRNKGDKASVKKTMRFYKIRERTNVALSLIVKSFNYIGPIVSVAFLVFTVQFFTKLNYSIEVILGGESLGYVRNEAVYDDAEKYMHDKIYFGNSDKVIYTTPTFRIEVVNDELLQDSKQLSNKIVMAMSSEVSEAYGLYVADEFIGATTDKAPIETAINGVLDSYRTGNKDERVKFKNDVRLVKGLYLKETVKDSNEIAKLVTSETETEQNYKIVQGDSLSLIADKNDLTMNELKALNPGLSANQIKPGQNVKVRRSKPYLSVIKTGLITFEDNIPYETIKVEDSAKSKGYTSVSQKGKEGKAQFTAEVTIEDGIEIDRNVLDRKIIEQPVDQKVIIGTKALPAPTTPAGGGKAPSGPAVVNPSASGFIWPVQSGGYISCGFLCYKGHTAIDIQSFAGDNNLASKSGTVIKAVRSSVGYGNHVIIDHGDGVQTLYAHHSKLYVTVGQFVTQGTPIGAQGMSGNASGIHLHFEIRIYGRPQNPLPYLPR